MPVLRSKLTQAIEVNEYAVVFIASGIIESVGRDAVSAAANGIYRASLNFFPGLVFIISSAISLFAIPIIGYE